MNARTVGRSHRWLPGLLHQVAGQYVDPKWDEAAHTLEKISRCCQMCHCGASVCVYVCVCVCVCVCEPRTTVGAQPLCCDNRFDSNQCPTESINPFSFCKNTHLRVCARTHAHASKHAGCRRGSEQPPLQSRLLSRRGILKWTQKKTRRRKPFSSLHQHPSPLLLPLSACLSLTSTHSL